MTNLEIMKRTEELEKQIANLRKAEIEMNGIKYGTCKHDIIAIIYRQPVDAFEAKCIFCGLTMDQKSERDSYVKKGSKLVDVSDSYKKIRNGKKIKSLLQNIYEKMTEEGMEIEDDLFEQAMKARLEAEIE